MWRLSRPLSSSTESCQRGRTETSSVVDWLRATISRTPAGAYLLEKFDSLKRRREDDGRRRVTNAQLRRLNRKIDKLLSRLDDAQHISTDATNDGNDECVVCLSAEATMQTFPCAHRVTCRRCFVRTIQTAISERNLPLRCVVCRARILTLNAPQHATSTDDQPTHQSHHDLADTTWTDADTKFSPRSAASYFKDSEGERGLAIKKRSSSSRHRTRRNKQFNQ